MLSVSQQIDAGLLVCPRTWSRLHRDGDLLLSEAGTQYRISQTMVPILLMDAMQADRYVAASSQMVREYQNGSNWAGVKKAVRALIRSDYRTRGSREATEVCH